MSAGSLTQVGDDESVKMAAGRVTSAATSWVPIGPVAFLALGLGGHGLWAKVMDGSHSTPDIVLTTLAGALMLIAGCVRAIWPGGRHLGLLMIWTSIGMYLEDVQLSPDSHIQLVGDGLRLASIGPLAHLILSFPTSHLPDGSSRMVVRAAYLLSFVAAPLTVVVPRYVHVPYASFGWETWDLWYLVEICAVPVGFYAVAILARRWLSSSPVGRRALGPVVLLSATAAVSSSALGVIQRATSWYTVHVQVYRITALFLPLALLLGDLTVQRARVQATQLFAALPRNPSHGQLEQLLRRTLRDPTLRLMMTGQDGLLRTDGRREDPDASPRAGRAHTAVRHDGVPVAVLDHDVVVLLDADLLNAVASGVGLMLANSLLATDLERTAAEAAARQKELISLNVAEKARLERDLHDGVQADLVAALAMLRLEQAVRDRDCATADPTHDRLAHVETCLAEALSDVRRLARGVRPGSLDALGLVAALRSLAERLPVIVDLDAPGDLGWGDPVDTTLYYVVHEALTNATRHGGAHVIRVRLRYEDGAASVEVSDDGNGGARLVPGGGLDGLATRVAAVGGTFHVDGGGDGSTVRVRVPVG